MSKRMFVPIVLACVLAAGVSAMSAEEKGNTAQQPPAKSGSVKDPAAKDAGMPSHEEMMAAWMKLAAPGEHHAHLKGLAGSWKTVVKSWEGSDEPKVSEGTCETSLMMDGRYLK